MEHPTGHRNIYGSKSMLVLRSHRQRVHLGKIVYRSPVIPARTKTSQILFNRNGINCRLFDPNSEAPFSLNHIELKMCAINDELTFFSLFFTSQPLFAFVKHLKNSRIYILNRSGAKIASINPHFKLDFMFVNCHWFFIFAILPSGGECGKCNSRFHHN